MDKQQQATLADYKRKGFAERSGFGEKPALLIVDFIKGFTDPASPLGGDFSNELSATRVLLDAFRGAQLPVVFTTTAYADAHCSDGGAFVRKVPALKMLRRGAQATEVDPRIAPVGSERVVEKKFASAFFATKLDTRLRECAVDTVVVCGCTTSGCVRASVVDSMQYGFTTVIASDAVGDRAQAPHVANLFDMDAKYGDLMNADEVVTRLHQLATGGGLDGTANDSFMRWWQAREPNMVEKR